MGDKEDYLTNYRMFFEYFAATVDPEDQLPVQIAGYTITESELPGEVLHWLTQYFSQKQCPETLLTALRHIILDDVRIASKKSPQEFGYKPDEAVYEALRLMQAVTARANAICLRYLDNSKLDTLPPPPTPTHTQLLTVSCAEKNSRRVMEDRHVQIGNLEELFGVETTEPTSFYAVYDGHAGSAAAIYCAVHLHQYLLESPHFTTDLQRAMRDAFLRTDAEFVRKSNQGMACGGSTAVAVCVRGRRLLAAWAGDSLALLAKRMRLMQLVCAHKPHREDEKERIESSGGTVMYWGTWRVNGQLAVSRAIGDAQYKPYVTARPEIAIVDLDGDEDFVVIACDGLWDFVSEDDVALTVYRQIAANPDDVNAVTKRLTEQAKRQGSTDNISIIVVFLKDPHAIASDNGPPMDLGLDNALANGPPFPADNDACKRLPEAAVAGAVVVDSCDNDNDNGHDNGVGNGINNGMDNSDSDDEDLGPETAVDADDIDAETREQDHTAATPPVQSHDEPSHLEAPADNVAESGEDSDDEWNYFRGEGEPRADTNDQDNEQDLDLPTSLQRSPTPCQDNSAWESSSVDMNSSPLNPDAPVFVPGSVAGSDVLLAESPRKPLPMDDIELPDVAQFETGAVIRPAELLDLDNCNQLNGHHNISLEEKENLNGNNKCSMDSLGFGFNVGNDKETALLQDFDRIQKDTTDFCNIQVFQTTLETNPFASEGNDELFERLKNKEMDPMSMSFYQEKDDDTCERLTKPEPQVDLNAVQPLPESDDEDLQLNGHNSEDNKENMCTDENSDILGVEKIQEPNNDILTFGERTENYTNFNQLNNLADFTSSDTSNVQTSEQEFESHNVQEVAQTDTPESHKLLFEQIPEIPDGKSSELGFTNEDHQLSEDGKEIRAITPQDETSQEIVLEHTIDERIAETIEAADERHEDFIGIQESKERLIESAVSEMVSEDKLISPEPVQSNDELAATPSPAPADKTCAEVHHEPVHDEFENDTNFKEQFDQDEKEYILDAPEIRLEAAEPELERLANESPLPTESPMPIESPKPSEPSLPTHSPVPAESPVPAQSPLPADSQLPAHSPLPVQSPLLTESSLVAQSPLLTESLQQMQSELVSESPLPANSPLLAEALLPAQSPVTAMSPVTAQSPLQEDRLGGEELRKSPMPIDSPTPLEAASPAPVSSDLPRESPAPAEATTPADVPLPRESPAGSPTPLAEARERPADPTEPTEPIEPQPDVVPEASRSELVTDIDIGIPESRAQEICVPVTSELAEDAPALDKPPLSDAPIAAAAAATALAAAATAAVVTATKAKTPAKKSPTTPTLKPATAKSATARTPLSAAKKPLTPAAARTPTGKTTSASKPATPASKPTTPAAKSTAPAAKTAATAKPAPARTSTVAARPAATAASRPISAPTRTSTTRTTTAMKPAPAKEAPVSAKTSATSRAAPRATAPRSAPPARTAPPAATRPAPRPAPARAAPAPAAPRPAPRAAPVKPKDPAAPKPKPIEKKPLTNGDVKPAAARAAPRPTPRPAPITKTTAARPLDKQSKDLANKRITAKAAPPRTAATKPAPTPLPAGAKPPPIRKPARAAPPPDQLDQQLDKQPDKQLDKQPDAAALPDVIA